MRRRRSTLTALAAVLVLVLAACSGAATDSAQEGAQSTAPQDSSDTVVDAAAEPAAADHPADHADDHSEPSKLLPLRKGERRVSVKMPAAYTPEAPNGSGTDDYRCFILDPDLAQDAFITGTNVLPDNTDIVHHVILFRIAPDRVAEAEAEDARTPGIGYTCFGDAGMVPGEFSNIDDAPWLGAWAPGGTENKTRNGFGVDFPQGSRIVMQVHYNLLDPERIAPDRSSTQIRVMDKAADLTPIHTYLTPGPVELPCRPGKDASPLCDRTAAIADNKARFGEGPGGTNDALHFLCNSPVEASEVTSCTRTIGRPMTILAAAGHMHLLGKQLSIQTNVGTPREELLLEKKLWDFDDQGATAIEPVRVEAGDEVTITCRHSQELRDYLPEFEGQPDRYVVWGQGTTDEMCLGMLTVAFA
ncbi:hypothetical protein GCM10027020_20580 [Nocardioides salsibiostraticola]